LTRGTDEKIIARAALESICFQVSDVLKAMEKDFGNPIPILKANGGATRNNYLMQFQSDILNLEVCRSTIMETTALGAAYLAGLAVNYWKDIDEIKEYKENDCLFKPNMNETKRTRLIKEWNIAVAATKSFKI